MKKLFTVLLVALFAMSQLIAQAPVIVFITPDDRDDAQVEFLQNQGFNVFKVWTESISEVGQDTLAMLNMANLIIHGRSPNSGTTDSPDKEVWNAVTAPMIINSQWVARSSRMNWFESTNAYHENEGPAVAYANILIPDDPIFQGVTLDGDSLGWCLPPHDFIGVDSAINGEVVAMYGDRSPLVVRFNAGEEFYPGSVDMPAGPRTYWGMGNDNAGWANFFPLTKAAKQVYLNEITRMMGIPAQVAVFGPADTKILLVTDDDQDDAQFNWLALQGFDVMKFWPGDALSEAGQDTIDMLNGADLIIHGRSPNSGTTDSPDKEAWNALTAPMIVNSQWVARSSRMNWFNSTNAYHENEAPPVAYATVLLPGDPIFSGITLDGDSVGWTYPPHDFIGVDSTISGEVVAMWGDRSPLVVRFNANEEFYPGSVDMPAGPRTYWGMGNDNAGWVNFFPLTNEAKQAYLAEISRMVDIAAPEMKLGPADFSITFVTDDDQDDPQIHFLEKNGIRVTKFWPGDALSAAGQDTIDMLNAADLIIHGRSPNSGTTDSPDKEAWNAITAPMIVNSQWVARSSRMNLFKSTNAYHLNDGPAVAYGTTDVPDDDVFMYVDLAGDSVAWCLPPHDFLENADSASNGEMIAMYNLTSPLLVRFEAGVEYYPGSVDMPAGPRSYFGIGNDNAGFPNFFPLTEEGQQIYLNEIARMLGAEMVEVVTVSSDASLASLEYDVATATLDPAFDPGTMSYTLQLVEDSSVVVLSGTASSEFATVEVDTVDVTSGDTLVGTVIVIAENGNQMEYDVTVHPFVPAVSIEPNEVEKLNVKLYPNPASDMIYIESAEEITQVTVYNAIGRVVVDQSFRNSNRVQLNLGELIPGMYMIRVDGLERSTMTKLLMR